MPGLTSMWLKTSVKSSMKLWVSRSYFLFLRSKKNEHSRSYVSFFL